MLGFDPLTQALLAAGGGMMAASGPSATPTSFGQAAGKGMLTGLHAFNDARLTNQKEMLGSLQARGMQQGLDDADRARSAIETFAAQLPPDKRALFLANPAGYIANASKRTTVSPGQTVLEGDRPVFSAAPNLTFQDTGSGIAGINPQTGAVQTTIGKTVSPDAAANLGQRKHEFDNLSAADQGRFQRQDRDFNQMSMAQRVAAGQRNTELGMQGLNTFYNTGMVPQGVPGIPSIPGARPATPPFNAAPSAQRPGVPTPPFAGAPSAMPRSPRAAQEVQTAVDKEVAVTQAKNAMDLPMALSKAEQAISLIDQMVGDAKITKDGNWSVDKGKRPPHSGFQSVVGATWMPGQRFIHGTDAASFDALYEQVKGGAFLQAFETLKGGGQITQVEGDKATAAITRMQRAQSEGEFIKAAREFQEAARSGMQKAKQKAGQAAGGWSIEPMQ